MAIDLTSSPFTAPDSCDNFAYGVLPSLTKKLFNELCSRLRYTISELEAFIATGDISFDGDDDTQHADPECSDNLIGDLMCISDASGESLLSSEEESMFKMLLRDSPSPSPPQPSESVTDHMRASLSTTSRLSPPSAAATHSSSLSTTEEEYHLLVRQFPEMFFMVDLSPVMTVQISRDSDTQNLEQEYHHCFRNKFRVHTTPSDSSTHSVHDCEYYIQDPSLPPSRTPSRVETEQHFKRRPTEGSRSAEIGKGLRIPVSSKQAKKHQHERRPRSLCKHEFESSRLPAPIMGTCPNKRIDDPRPCVFYPIYLPDSPSSRSINFLVLRTHQSEKETHLLVSIPASKPSIAVFRQVKPLKICGMLSWICILVTINTVSRIIVYIPSVRLSSASAVTVAATFTDTKFGIV